MSMDSSEIKQLEEPESVMHILYFTPSTLLLSLKSQSECKMAKMNITANKMIRLDSHFCLQEEKKKKRRP